MAELSTSTRTYSAEENNDIAHRFFTSAWNDGNLQVIDELIAPDAVDHSTVGGKEKSELGGESFKQIITMFRAAIPDIKLTIEDEIFAGDKVVHRWNLEGTNTGPLMGIPPTNKKVRFTGTTIVRMRDGKIVERWTNVDELGLLQQLGVVPPPPDQA